MDRLGLLDDGRARLVDEAVEDAGGEKPLAGGAGLVGRIELDLDEDLVRVFGVAKQAVPERGAACARRVPVEQRLPGVVVADLDASENESYIRTLPRYLLS